MFVAIATTTHFEFIALGHTQKEAESAMLSRWEKHCQQFPAADPSYMQELIEGGDVQMCKLDPGTAVNFGYDN